MSDPKDERVELSELARDLFAQTREGDPSPEAIEALRRSLEWKLGSSGSSGAPSSEASVSSEASRRVGKGLGALGGVVWTLALGTLAVVSVVATRAANDDEQVDTSLHESSVSLPDPVSNVDEPAFEPSASTESIEPESAAVQSAPPARATRRPGPDEARYIESIRRAMERNPTRALRLARAHSSRFSAPTMAEEARALEVEALAHTGRKSEARQAANAFFARYPSTPYRRRVERALDASPWSEGR